MVRNTTIYPAIRLALALCVSAVLHLSVISLSVYLWKEEHPPLPKPENWKFDVVMASRGEGLSHKPEAPVIKQKTTTRAQRENKPRVKPLVLAKKTQEAPASKGEETPAKLVEETVAVKPPAVMQQPTDAQKQAEALAGAMANLANMQFVLGQMKIFYTATREQTKSTITAKLTEEMLKQYAGAVCTIRLNYATPAIPADFTVDCGERQELAEMLAFQIDWRALPQPDKYFLPYRNMKITLWFEGYQTRIGLKTDD